MSINEASTLREYKTGKSQIISVCSTLETSFYIYSYVLHTSFIYHIKWRMKCMWSMEYMFRDVW